MNSVRSKSQAANSRMIKSGAWLISFGDLLTLLLCTFVLVLATNDSESAPQLGHNQANLLNIQSAREHSAHNRPQSETGTSLAFQLDSEPWRTLDLVQSDFNFIKGTLSAEALGKLRGLLESVTYPILQVQIEACGPGAVAPDIQSWNTSFEHALLTRSQVIDMDVSPKLLRIRVVGPHCDSLEHETVHERGRGPRVVTGGRLLSEG